ncbi:MAG: hypothetical protein ACP5KW_09170 [Thermoproteota archaeon]
MVYSITYYATEFIVRAVLSLYYGIKDWLERRAHVTEKEEKKPEIPPGYVGWLKKYDEAGNEVLEWYGNLKVRIPQSHIDLAVNALDLSDKRPTRYYTTFNEFASKNWFKEVEAMSKLIKGEAKGG